MIIARFRNWIVRQHGLSLRPSCKSRTWSLEKGKQRISSGIAPLLHLSMWLFRNVIIRSSQASLFQRKKYWSKVSSIPAGQLPPNRQNFLLGLHIIHFKRAHFSLIPLAPTPGWSYRSKQAGTGIGKGAHFGQKPLIWETSFIGVRNFM